MNRKLIWKLLDSHKRKLFLKNELKKLIFKSLIKNTNLQLSYRYFILYNKSKLIRYNSVVQQKNKCIVTGRVWSTVKLTRYSRFLFRTESNNGNLPGFRRASW